jgi:hypothetical protein
MPSSRSIRAQTPSPRRRRGPRVGPSASFQPRCALSTIPAGVGPEPHAYLLHDDYASPVGGLAGCIRAALYPTSHGFVPGGLPQTPEYRSLGRSVRSLALGATEEIHVDHRKGRPQFVLVSWLHDRDQLNGMLLMHRHHPVYPRPVASAHVQAWDAARCSVTDAMRASSERNAGGAHDEGGRW